MIAAERDGLYLRLIAEAIADIQRRMSDADITSFLQDRDEQALTAFRLSVIGENANKLSQELKSRHPELPWAGMVAFRNIVSHEYHRVRPERVWDAAFSLDDIAAMAASEITQEDN
jgi:uncharacterized protein with HEPN domain